MTIEKVFDPRANALNALRLLLAVSVIVWHSFGLTGHHVNYLPAQRLIADVGVDGFFAISGFLITASWLSNPQLRSYFLARGLRILPGLWLCLAVTALIIAPIAVSIQGGSGMKLLLSRAPFEYILGNSAIEMLRPDIGGTPSGVPFPGSWNGSLWTLYFEAQCYVAIALFGVLGLLTRRWFIPLALALAVCWTAVLPSPSGSDSNVATFWQLIARFAVMFLAGALFYLFRDKIPARWSLVALCVGIVLLSSLMSNYRMLGGIALAYAVIVSGVLLKHKRLRLRTDLSYGIYIYAFPIQQLLVMCGLLTLNPMVFAIIATAATVPLAALSWFLLEKPAMALKYRLKQRRIARADHKDDESRASAEPAVAD
ncbi:acyltransferase family protein [Mycolicibacterium aichiense]|uniref:acyltransferase family protein n=1 Tax=Mycolicibacterium aichiense TaxID=1799 RepID=UPI003D6750CE